MFFQWFLLSLEKNIKNSKSKKQNKTEEFDILLEVIAKIRLKNQASKNQ